MLLKNIDLMFAKGRLAVCHKHKFYMTLIPKNLSSAAIYFILNSDYPQVAEKIDINSPGTIHKYTGLVLVKSLNLDPSYKKLAVIRDPFERVVSAFYSKFVFDATWSDSITKPVADFIEKDVGSITFRDFIFFLQCHPDEWLDAHFTSQSRFMLFEDYDVYLPVYDKKALNDSLKEFGIEFSRINDTTMRYIPNKFFHYKEDNCFDIPVSELWRKCEDKIELPNYNFMKVSEIEDVIRNRYKEDYDLLLNKKVQAN